MTRRHTLAHVLLPALPVALGCFGSHSPASERADPAPPVGGADAGPADPAPAPPPEAADGGAPAVDAAAPAACVPSQLTLKVSLSGTDGACGDPDGNGIHWGSVDGLETTPLDDGVRFSFRLLGAGECRLDVRGVGSDIAESLSRADDLPIQASFRGGTGPEQPFVLFERSPDCASCSDCECPPPELLFFAASRPLDAPAPEGADVRLSYYSPEAVTFTPGSTSCEAELEDCTYRQLTLRAEIVIRDGGPLTRWSAEIPVGRTHGRTGGLAVRNLRLERSSCSSGRGRSRPDAWVAWAR